MRNLRGLAEYAYCKLGARMYRLAVAVWELRLNLGNAGQATGAWRVVVFNPTGHTCTIQVHLLSFTPQFHNELHGRDQTI